MAGETFTAVQEIVAGNLGIDAAGVTMESRLAEDLGADSLDAVELIMALEERFGIEFDNDDAEAIKTVGDVVQAIEALTA
jgi:acyl carrier protein